MSAIIQKRIFLNGRRLGQHNPRRRRNHPSDYPVRVATAHNLASTHGHARLNLPPVPTSPNFQIAIRSESTDQTRVSKDKSLLDVLDVLL
jgi:hypothetical protein